MRTLIRNFVKVIGLAIIAATLTACSGGHNFSQFPGFSEYFESNAPIDQTPGSADMALLEKYKPTIYKAKDQREPIDFYQDYISQGKLVIAGKTFDKVTSEVLNQYRDDPEAHFQYSGNYKQKGSATVYGRIDRQTIQQKGKSYHFTFLTYNLVFPVSGILKELGVMKSLGLSIGGNLNDWHQLDHYVGVTIALLDNIPTAFTLQQHNYHTTYLFEDDNNRVAIDIAMRSNEVYPHKTELTKHPAVGFLSADNIEFLMTGKNKPMMAGYDVTHGEVEVNYQLKVLPQTDAFYQFKGLLGKTRLLPGRSGPPGADYATLPGLMPRTVRLFTGYRSDNLQTEIALFNKLFNKESFVINKEAILPFQIRFLAAIAN